MKTSRLPSRRIMIPLAGILALAPSVACAKSGSSAASSSEGGTTDYSSGRIGMLALSSNIVMNNASVDSYDSSRGLWNADTNRGDDVVVATRSSYSKVQFQNAEIFGEIAVGASTRSAGVGYTAQGKLWNADTSSGTKVDTDLIHTGVTIAACDTPVAPTNSGDTFGMTLPQNLTGSMEMGVAGSTLPSYYYTHSGANLNLSGNQEHFTVLGPTVLVVNGSLNLAGAGGITVNEGAWVAIYVTGNITVKGNSTSGGLDNLNTSGNHAIFYGVGGSGQNMALEAGSLTAAFYGPGYNVNVNGSGDWCGSIVASYINFSGSGGFHYDSAIVALDPVSPSTGIVEAITDTSTGATTSPKTTYGITGWRELGSRSGVAYARDTNAPFNL